MDGDFRFAAGRESGGKLGMVQNGQGLVAQGLRLFLGQAVGAGIVHRNAGPLVGCDFGQARQQRMHDIPAQETRGDQRR